MRVSLPNSRQRPPSDEQLSFGGGGEGEPAELSTTGEVTNDGGSRPKKGRSHSLFIW